MEEDYLKFYHISRDASDQTAEQFLDRGIVPNAGMGYGGQTQGFYCWTSEERAQKYYCSLVVAADAEWAMEKFGIDIRLKDGNALKLEAKIKKSDIKYPNWQLDNEQHANVKRGRERSVFFEFWESQKEHFQNKECDFTISPNSDEEYHVKGLNWNEEKKCPVIIYEKEGKLVSEDVDSTKAEYSFRTQAINDYLCRHNPEYEKSYNQLIIGVAENKPEIEINGYKLHTRDIPIKYCATEPLQDINIYKLHGEVAYDPDTQKRYIEESNEEYQWGDYRIKIQEEKLSKPTNSNSQYLEQVREKLAKRKNIGFQENNSAPINKEQQPQRRAPTWNNMPIDSNTLDR